MNCSMFIRCPDPGAVTGMLTVPIDVSVTALTIFLASSIYSNFKVSLKLKTCLTFFIINRKILSLVQIQNGTALVRNTFKAHISTQN
jgi:hypothetical protein